jgi:hypothetical protein
MQMALEVMSKVVEEAGVPDQICAEICTSPLQPLPANSFFIYNPLAIGY